MLKRIAGGVLGTVAILCGVLGCGYAVTALGDVAQYGPTFAGLVGSALLWLVTMGAFGLGADFVTYAIAGRSLRVPPRLRAVSVGVLSFFPGFLIGFSPSALYELLRHPNDSQAPLCAFWIGAVVGVVLMLTVSFVLLRRTTHLTRVRQ